MNISVSLYLDKRSKKTDGTYSLKLVVRFKKETVMINLGIYLQDNQWIDDKVVNHPTKRILNNYIETKYIEAKTKVLELKMSGNIHLLSKDDIKNYIEGKEINKTPKYLVKEHFEYFIGSKYKSRTKELYKATLNYISKYTDIESLYFEDITVQWLRAFEKFLIDRGLAVNTIAIELRNIRAVFNNAIDEEKISLSSYPFRKFSIKTEETAKRSLSVKELVKLRDYPCKSHQEKYRDIFMLSFYLIGINPIDLFSITEIKNGRIDYRRAKTGRLYSIKVEPEALQIINKYKGENQMLFVLDNYSNYKNFLDRLNNNIQEIEIIEKIVNGKKVTQKTFSDLTVYWARHSWATIAALLDIPKETIAAALGHGGKSVTDIYINFDMRKVDEANRKVIDHVNTYSF